MLKAINIGKKCAEILWIETAEVKFCIQCICGVTTQNYDAFQQHFRNNHLPLPAAEKATVARLTSDITETNLHAQQIKDPLSSDAIDVLPLVGNTCLEEPLLALSKAALHSATAETTNAKSTDDCSSVLHDNVSEVDWGEPYAPMRQQRRPYKQRNQPNRCTYCGRTFQRRYLLDTHVNIHTGRKPHQCEMCGKQFRAVSTLTRHLRTHEERDALQCQYCDKLFTHRSALVSHEMRHTQQRRWPCPICQKLFYTENQMDTHRRKLHAKANSTDETDEASGSLPFTCELCGNNYRSSSMLSTHKAKKHYRLAKYSCEQCGQKFVDSERLQQHQLIHINPAVAAAEAKIK